MQVFKVNYHILSILAASLLAVAGCSKMEYDAAMSPSFELDDNIIYDGQSYVMPPEYRGVSWIWVSGSADNLVPDAKSEDGSSMFVCHLPDGFSTRDVRITGLEREHPEYTFETVLSCHPWTFVLMDASDNELAACSSGEIVYLSRL